MRQKIMQLGRSMVEMLGVLAIIGVLSIVGIQGYKKAVNKIRANELMDMAMKVHNENLAQAVVDPKVLSSVTASILCSNVVPTSGSGMSSSVINACNSRNLGMPQPSWNTSKSFSIRSSLKNTTENTHIIAFTGLDDECGVCNELKAMTEETSETGYRRLPGSISPDLSNGLLILCRTGATSTSRCW